MKRKEHNIGGTAYGYHVFAETGAVAGSDEGRNIGRFLSYGVAQILLLLIKKLCRVGAVAAVA